MQISALTYVKYSYVFFGHKRQIKRATLLISNLTFKFGQWEQVLKQFRLSEEDYSSSE